MSACWKVVVCCLFLLLPGIRTAHAQMVVIADADSHQPVSHASLYTKEDGVFYSCISNEQGVARVNFTFQRLTISHLNYEKRIVRRLNDTIFLKPKYLSKAEVVITNKEPEWIRRCLKQVVKRKNDLYFSRHSNEAFIYNTQSLGNNNLYRYHLTGLVRMKDIDNRYYAIIPDTSHIVAIDSTKLTDLVNLERMLYEDFVAELDNGFIRSHHFLHNAHFKGANKNEVELRFRSKNRTDDRGWFVMDTVNYSILSAYRFTGTKTNRSERINSILYAMAQVFGYSIDTWTRDYHVTYKQRQDGTFYPAEVRLKMFFSGKDGDLSKEQENYRDQTGGGFPNMEATLNLSPCEAPTAPTDQWIELPSTWYIKINTEKDRQRVIQLSNLPATFNLFDDEL